MSNPSVLIEAYNLGLHGGTGIATYIANLLRAVRANGYSVDGLLHSYASLPQKEASSKMLPHSESKVVTGHE